MSTGLSAPGPLTFFLNSGAVNALGTVETYLILTATPVATYTNYDLGTQNSTTVSLDAAGRPASGGIYCDPAVSYTFIEKDALGATVKSYEIAALPSITAPVTLTRTSIGSTSTDALILTNTTSAANAAQQWSPRAHWTGAGWNATASASRVVDVLAEAVPYQQASGDPTVLLVVSSQVNSGGYTPTLGIGSGTLMMYVSAALSWASSGLLSADVTLTRAAAGRLQLAAASATLANGGNLSLVSTDSEAADKGGTLGLGGSYTGTTATEFASVSGRKENSTDAQTGGYLVIATKANGASLAEAVRVKSDKTVLLQSSIAERNRSYAMGATQTRTFSAGNFAATGGTWDVASGDVVSETYRVVGDTVWYTLNVLLSTTGSAPSALTIVPPGGFTSVSETVVAMATVTVGGTTYECYATANAGTPGNITITPKAGGDFANGTDTANVYVQLNYKVA